jgi:hypothetical protein
VWTTFADAIAKGAAVSVDEVTIRVRLLAVGMPQPAPDPGRARFASCNVIQVVNLVIHGGGRIMECLPKVFLFEKRILAENLFPIAVRGQNLKDPSHGDSHSANARFASTLAGFDGDAVKRGILSHPFQCTRFPHSVIALRDQFGYGE